MALQLPAYRNPVEGFTTMGQTLNTSSLSMSAPNLLLEVGTSNASV